MAIHENKKDMKDHQNKSVTAITLGCKLNYAESSAILDKLSQQGWKLSTKGTKADLLIIHTCAVTQQAEQKCRQKIRSLIRNNPESRIAVIGCYSQLHPEILSEINGINAILGSNDKFDSIWYDQIFQKKTSTPLVKVTHPDSDAAIGHGYSLPAQSSQERTRAFLKIQDGCDYGCSYCTIPLIRGKSRSIPATEIVERASLLASSGYREIILTGVNTGDYHHDNVRLCDLLRQLEKIDICRIRISSIEPDIVNHELISLVAGSRIIVPHFHIPLQSGSDTILNAMRRRYNTTLYRNKVFDAVESITGCAIGADVMVGYPGETEEDFLNMYRFIEELPLAYLHVFSCSVRAGTHLARQIEMRECKPVTPEVISHRYRMLVELGYKKERKFKLPSVGNICMVLFENPKLQKKGIHQCSGYTPNYQRVIVESEDHNMIHSLKGNELPVLIDSVDEDLNLKGRVLS